MNVQTKTLSFDDFLKQALLMKLAGQSIEFNPDSLDDFQIHLLRELKKGIPEDFNLFLVQKTNQMQGLQSYEEYTRWFLFQMLIYTY